VAWFAARGVTTERVLSDIQDGCCPGVACVVRPAV